MIFLEAIGNLLTKYKWDLLAVLLLSFIAPLFFYKLGQSSLVSWDEAWYAEIARNVLKTGDFFNLVWNNKPYFDHPPLGFWLSVAVFKIFGISEFWVRFPSAILGMLSLVFVYFLGKELFNRMVGFVSAVALSSAPWFLNRSRSGDLDSPLVFFFILTFFLGVKAVDNKKYLIPFAISLSCLFLTKTLVPFTILIPLIIIFWPKIKKIQILDFLIPFLIFLILTLPWFYIQSQNNKHFIDYYFKIGFPGASIESAYLENLLLAKTYLHNGIGKWFWPGIISLPLGILFFQRKFLIFPAFFLAFLMPIFFSDKINIWHLIPLQPFLILSFFAVFYHIFQKIIHQQKIVFIFMLVLGSYFWFVQTRQNWYNFIDIPAYISDEDILSREAGKFDYPFFIDGDFEPAAAFYSGKYVKKISRQELLPLFQKKTKVVLIVPGWRLKEVGITADKYRIIKEDRDKILIIKN